MAQIVIDIDDEALARIDQASQAQGQSRDTWIAERIDPALSWPASVRDLAGAWKDFPTLEEIRSGYGPGAPREPF